MGPGVTKAVHNSGLLLWASPLTSSGDMIHPSVTGLVGDKNKIKAWFQLLKNSLGGEGGGWKEVTQKQD